MIRFKTGSLLLLMLLLAAPAAPIAVANFHRVTSGKGFEPWADNLIMYVLLLLVFGAAAAAILGFFWWKNLRPRAWDVIAYALVGAAGATSLTTLFDALDSYFSPPGIGWFLPGVGLIFGTIFGATFRGICEFLPSLESGRE